MTTNNKGASFLVGIDEYDDPCLKDLSISQGNINSIVALLQEPASQFNPPSNEFNLSNRRVTYKDLEAQLSKFLKIKAYTKVLIYFSGHGYQIWDRDSANWKGYLATSNSQIFKDEDDDKKFTNQNYGLAFITIARLIAEATHLKRLVLLIDSCHSGHAITTQELQNSLLKLSQKSSEKAEDDTFRYCIIASSLSSEESFTEDGTGVFTKALVEQLGAKNAGPITAERLIASLTDNFKSRHPQTIKHYNTGLILLMDYPSIGAKEPTNNPIRDKDGEPICPYRGLSYFDDDKDHQKFFFGRKYDIEKIRKRLKKVAFVPVIGDSGSGKSSLVRAGLVQRELRQKEEGAWHIEIIKPEDKPLRRFLDALRKVRDAFNPSSDGYKLIDDYVYHLSPVDFIPESFDAILEALRGDKKYLLVIDQFEQVFTLATSTSTVSLQDQLKEVHNNGSGDRADLSIQERDCFLKLVTRVAQVKDSPLKVVVTLRADFLGKCLTHPALKNLIEENVVLVAPLIGRGLVDAIEKPAAAQGYPLDPELVDALVRDAGNQPGFLPLLEFTLERLWEKRVEEPPHIPLDAYEEPGNLQTKTGLKQALNIHANKVYEFANFDAKKGETLVKRSKKEQDWIRLIFLRLLRTGQGDTDTRFPQALSGLLSIADPSDQGSLETVIESLIRGRLLVTYENQNQQKMLDLAHEALIDGWEQFKEWRVKGGEIRRSAERLEQAWREWDKATENKTQYLISRALLAQVRENWSQIKLYLGDLEEEVREFFYLSDQYEKAEKLELQLQVDASQIERKIAGQRSPHEILTEAISMVGRNREYFPDRLIGNVPAALRQVVENIFTSHILCENIDSDSRSVAFSPDGKTIVSGSRNTVRLWNLDGTPKGKPFEGHTGYVISVAFSPDGQTIVSGSGTFGYGDYDQPDNTVRLWNLDGTPKGKPFEGHGMPVNSVAFNPIDGQTIVSGSDDYTVRLWNLDGTPKGNPFSGHIDSVNAVAFSPDGQTIVSCSGTIRSNSPIHINNNDNTVRLWDLDGNPKGDPFKGHAERVNSVAFSPDGQTIVSGSGTGGGSYDNRDNTVRLWNLDGTPKGLPFWGHISSVKTVAFSPDGQTIVSGSDDRQLRLWNLDGTPKGNPLEGHTGYISSVAFSPDGQTIVSCPSRNSYLIDNDNTVKLWNLDGTPKGNPLKGDLGYVRSVAFSPDGQTIVSCGASDYTVQLWNLDGTPKGKPFEGHKGPIIAVAFSPDGQTIVSGSNDGTVRLWNLDSTPIGKPFEGHNNVSSVAFSPDGQTIVSCGDQTVRLWNLDGTPKAKLEGHTDYLWSVTFSPDGKTIVSCGGSNNNGVVRVWDASTGHPINKPFVGHSAHIRSIAFSPNGQTIVSASDDKLIRLWNLDGTLIGKPFEGHTGSVSSVAFSPDGMTIVSCSSSNGDDNTVRLWNLDGTLIGKPFEGHRGRVNAIAFSPDGQTIVSGSDDGTVRLWSSMGWRSWLRTCLQRLGNNWAYDQNGLAYRASLFEQGYTAAEQGELESARQYFIQAFQYKKTAVSEYASSISAKELEVFANQLIAPILMKQGQQAAQQGNVDIAQFKFEQAKQCNPALPVEPKAKAQRIAAPILKMQGIFAALNGNIEAAMLKFEQAKQCDSTLELASSFEAEVKRIAAPALIAKGKYLTRKNDATPTDVRTALRAYQTAQTYDATPD